MSDGVNPLRNPNLNTPAIPFDPSSEDFDSDIIKLEAAFTQLERSFKAIEEPLNLVGKIFGKEAPKCRGSTGISSTKPGSNSRRLLDLMPAELFSLAAIGNEANSLFAKNTTQQQDAPKSLKNLKAGLQTQREMVISLRQQTQVLPGRITLLQESNLSFLPPLEYPKKFHPICLQIIQHSCSHLRGIPSLLEATTFLCIESLDTLITHQQDKNIQKELNTLRTGLIQSGFSTALNSEISVILRRTKEYYPDNLIHMHPIKKVQHQKQTLTRHLDQQFNELFEFFEYLVGNAANTSSIISTKLFSFTLASTPDKLAKFFTIQSEGIKNQQIFIETSKQLPLDIILSSLCPFYLNPHGWILSASRCASKRLSKESLTTHLHKPHHLSRQLHHLIERADLNSVPGAKSAFKETAQIADRAQNRDFTPIFFLYSSSEISRAIEAIASIGMPDEFHMWISEVNIVRLEFLLDYAKSCLFMKKSTFDTNRHSRKIVQNISNTCGLQDKNTSAELRTILSTFLDGVGQLRFTVVDTYGKAFSKYKGIDPFLAEKSSLATAMNYNLVVIDWLGTQLPMNEAIESQLAALHSIQKQFLDSIATFLQRSQLPQNISEKILKELISISSSSFFSPDHEALIALSLYTQQWNLLMDSPKGEKQISLGFDQTISESLQSMLHLMETSIATTTQQESGPTQTPAAEKICTNSIEEVTAKLAQITFSSTNDSTVPTDTEMAAAPAKEPISKRSKKQKKRDATARKTAALVKEKKPTAPIDTERAAAEPILPTYWRKYCDVRCLVDLAESAGYEYEPSNGGSHRKYVRQIEGAAPSIVIIPYHPSQDVSPGVARKVLSQILNFYAVE